MKHYPHHIGDFDKSTRHLTRLERSIYRDLMDLYYDTELPISSDLKFVCRKIIARSDEEIAVVEQTLKEFFVETPKGWYHDRCEVEIATYKANNSQKAQAGKASAASKVARRNEALKETPTDDEHPLISVETPLNSRCGAVETPLNGTSTNQNQNQNQNQEHTHSAEVLNNGEKPENVCVSEKPVFDDLGDVLPANPDELPDAPITPSMVSAVCMAMKATGIGAVNPSHPDLRVLLAQGADLGLFVSAAGDAVKKGKGFAYALGIVRGQLSAANALAKDAMQSVNRATRPINRQEALEERNRKVADAWAAQGEPHETV